MKLKEFVENVVAKDMMKVMGRSLLTDLVELEAIEQKLNVLWGIKLDINVVENVEKEEGRFFGKGLIGTMTQS